MYFNTKTRHYITKTTTISGFYQDKNAVTLKFYLRMDYKRSGVVKPKLSTHRK